MAAPGGAPGGEGPTISELMRQGDQIATHKCVAVPPRLPARSPRALCLACAWHRP